MAVSSKMNSVTQILAAVLAAVSCSFIQTSSDPISSALNSTFFVASERLFKPIYIPDIVNYSEDSQISKSKVPEAQGMILKSSLQSEEISQEKKVREKIINENTKTTASPLKFSSRYSTKEKETSKDRTSRSKKTENPKEDERKIGNSLNETLNLSERREITKNSSKSDNIPPTEKHKTFSDRSDELGEEESEEIEESIEIAPTTSEPYLELQKPTSFRKYSDEDFDNYETTSTEMEENDDLEETNEENEKNKRLIGDYYNSDSKNYHSIQTPLDKIKYRGHHSSKSKDFKPETVRTRLVSPISRRPPSHNWPYSRSQIKGEFEKLNEISDGDESYEKLLDEGVKKEVKSKLKQSGLELAIEKDELKFDRSKKYNHIHEKNRRNQQQKSLSIEEEKDDKVPLFQTLNQYLVNERKSNYQPKLNISKERIWPPISTLSTVPKNIFKIKTPSRRQPMGFNVSNELKPNFENHRFQGPIVFNHNLEQPTIGEVTKPFTKTQKQPIRNPLLKHLLENEKVDENKLTNPKIQKTIFENGSKEILSFNHLEESEEMYNAILANIRSVFGVKIQSEKSIVSSQKKPEIKLDESKPFTWSLPLTTKREEINERK